MNGIAPSNLRDNPMAKKAVEWFPVKVPWDLSVGCDFARSKSLSLDKISSDC